MIVVNLIKYAIIVDMSWATKRKFMYLGGIIIFIIVFIIIPIAFHLYKPPTCFDGKKNQGETGVDCGGPCTLLCSAEYAPLSVLWSRFSKVSDGVYNVLAYIENPNLNAGASNLDYVFKLYDKDGIILGERYGRTFAPTNKVLAVFEPEMRTGNLTPHRVEFMFSNKAIWYKQNTTENPLSVSQSIISRAETAPRLSTIITNKSLNLIKQIEAIGIVYNTDDNTIAFSRTIIDDLAPREERNINFNWPRPFSEKQARTEIILKILK